MLLLLGAETLQNIPENSDKAPLIQLHFGAADIWCCVGVAEHIQGKELRPSSASELLQLGGRSLLINSLIN